MSAPEQTTWWDRLCLLVGLDWEVPEAPVAALPSRPPDSAAQNSYVWKARLQDLKLELAKVSGASLAEKSYDHEIESALRCGHAVIVEMAAGNEVATIHAVAAEDMATFGTLSEWAAFTCSGRDVAFESRFYRIDVDPIETARECLLGGNSQGAVWLNGPWRVFPPPTTEEEDGDEGGPAAAPMPIRPRPPRAR